MPPRERLTLNQAIDKAGGWGKFQTISLIILTLASSQIGIFTQNIAVLTYMPVILCKQGEVFVQCTVDDICEDGHLKNGVDF